jgi:hypothetical protein
MRLVKRSPYALACCRRRVCHRLGSSDATMLRFMNLGMPILGASASPWHGAPLQDRPPDGPRVPVEPLTAGVECDRADVAFDDPPPRGRRVVAGDPLHFAAAHESMASFTMAASNARSPLRGVPRGASGMTASGVNRFDSTGAGILPEAWGDG